MGKSRKSNSQRQAVSKRSLPRLDLKSLGQGVLITIVIAYLFYKSVFGLVVGIVVIPFWMKLCKKKALADAKAKTAVEFKEYMMLIVAALQTGYSLEKALIQSEKELVHLYPKNSVIAHHVHVMNQKITMNVQVEKAFMEFAESIQLEEAESLAEIITFAKRSGGNYGKNIRDTAIKIEENLAVKEEIETITTEKRLELKVMCVMPMGILAYISLTSKGFIAPLYGNPLGIILMTICLVIYGALIVVGGRIIDIKV